MPATLTFNITLCDLIALILTACNNLSWKLIMYVFFPNRRDVNFLQTNVKVAYQNEFIIGIFFYITQMSLTWIFGPLTAYAFFIGERWGAREVGGSFYGLSDLLHESSAWCFSRTRTCEKTRACYIERNCWEGRLFANTCGLGCFVQVMM